MMYGQPLQVQQTKLAVFRHPSGLEFTVVGTAIPNSQSAGDAETSPTPPTADQSREAKTYGNHL